MDNNTKGMNFYNNVNRIDYRDNKYNDYKMDDVDYEKYRINKLDNNDCRNQREINYNENDGIKFNYDYSNPINREQTYSKTDDRNYRDGVQLDSQIEERKKINELNHENHHQLDKYNQKEFLYPKHSKVYMEEVDKLENICKKKQMDYKAINRLYLDYNKEQIMNKAKNKELVEELKKRSIEERIREVKII